MDILIKGIKMPVDHGIFIVICPDGTIEQKIGNADNGYPVYNIVEDAKAVALPENHGRLVDAGTIADNYLKYLMACFPMMNTEKANELISAVREALKVAPTIVEATE